LRRTRNHKAYQQVTTTWQNSDIQPRVPEPKVIPRTSSSYPPLLAEQQTAFFREVLTALNECNVGYAVTGAFALQRHTGIWHPTKDMDISLPQPSVPQALECLKRVGYRCEITDAAWLAKAFRADFFVDLITGMSNGVISVDEQWIERAHPALIVGVPTRVLAPEELLASKLFVARRERFDGADIAHILYATSASLDWDRLLTIIGAHWQLLLWSLVFFSYVYPAHVSMVPEQVWHELIGRFEKTIATPNSAAPFRGSLIDQFLFAIDVREWGMKDQLEEYRAQRLADSKQLEYISKDFYENRGHG
jgi:hypothetical protein